MAALANGAWPTRPLGEIIDLFDQLRVPLNSRERHERQGIYPYYGAQGVIDHIDAYRFDGRYILVAEDGENLNSKKLPLALFATGKFWVNNHAHVLRGKTGVADDAFLLACLNNADVKPFVTGAAQPKLSQSNLRQIEVPVPPLPIQRRIAGILSAYDELVENCQRRTRILEEMARALYRDWFVYFRFPDNEKLRRVDSPLGQIPKGWEIKTIADVCESVSYGYTASATRDEVGPKFLRITDIVPAVIDWARVPFCEIPDDKAPRYLLRNGDIVVARTGATTGYAKRLNRLHPNTVFASYLVRARANVGVSNRLLGILMESDEYKHYIQTNIGGAAQPQANAVVLTSMRLAVPPASIGEEFDRLVAPMIDEGELLGVKIQNLRRTRDLLLPRLLSGQVSLDVSAVEDVAELTTAAPLRALPRSQVQLGNEERGEEPALRAAEEAPPYRVDCADRGQPPPAEPANEAPVPIDQIDRIEVLQVIRQVFSEGPPRERDEAIRDVARALGYRRTGPRIQEILRTDLLTAVRRCILENQNGALYLCARSITDYDRDFLKQQFLAAIGRTWIDRDAAIRDFCRWLGFARTGPIIEDTARSLINGLLREGRLEAGRDGVVRRT